MACKNCDNENGQERADVRAACRVCELLDKDSSIKRVKYCNDCQAYLCAPCRDDITRRALAAAKNFGNKVIDAAKTLIAKAPPEKKFLTDDFGKEDEQKINGTSKITS